MEKREFINALLAGTATKSDDPDTATACVAVNPGGGFLCAANQLPLGVRPFPERIERPAKYVWILHAERNLVATAARIGFKLSGATLYMNWFPCADCAQVIVQAGIKKLVADREKYEARKDDTRYGFAVAMAMLTDAGVEIAWLDELED